MLKTLILAAAITLPPGSQGIWTSEDGSSLLGVNPTWVGTTTFPGVDEDGEPYGEPTQRRCELIGQAEGAFGYLARCDDGKVEALMFYDTGIAEFDGVRYIYGD